MPFAVTRSKHRRSPSLRLLILDIYRFLISSPRGDYNALTNSEIELPQLVATLYARPTPHEFPDLAVEYLQVDLHKSMTAAALFGIIASTPLHRSGSPRDASRLEGRNNVAALSDRLQSAMKFGPVRELEFLYLDHGAFLIADSTIDSNWITTTRLAGVEYPFATEADWTEQSLDTIFELLKLAGRQRDPLRTQVPEKPWNGTGNIYMDITMQEYNIFAEKVSRDIFAPCLGFCLTNSQVCK